MTNKDKYESFVEHPRYGQRPHFTGLNPQDSFLHWHSPPSCRIPETAIAADLERQTPATVAVTHYFDVERTCRDCDRSFIFFAREQQYWYETLNFGLDSDCVRCPECRKKQQGIAQARERYEELFHVAHRTTDETLEMASVCMELVKEGVFHMRQTEHIRMLLNSLPNAFIDDRRYKRVLKSLKGLTDETQK